MRSIIPHVPSKAPSNPAAAISFIEGGDAGNAVESNHLSAIAASVQPPPAILYGTNGWYVEELEIKDEYTARTWHIAFRSFSRVDATLIIPGSGRTYACVQTCNTETCLVLCTDSFFVCTRV